MLFCTTGAVLSFVFGNSDGTGRDEGGVPYLAIQIALYTVAFCFIAIRWREVLRAAWNVKWILALVALAVASSAWSQDPLFTLRRSGVLLATTAYGIYFGNRFTVNEQLRLLSWTFVLIVLSSLFLVVFLPQYGVNHGEFFGAWQGAFEQKNMQARTMVLASVVFYFVRPSTVSWVRWIGISASLSLLALSGSVTGVIVLILMLAVLQLPRLVRVNLTFLIPTIIGIGTLSIAVAFLIWTGHSDLLVLVGRSPTLTGRTELWKTLPAYIMQHPWLGYGFNTFWQGMQGASAPVLLRLGWYVRHSHNGFLDLTLDLGFVGLATFVAGYLVLSKRALQIVRGVPGPASYWLCAFMFLMLLYNLDESSILRRNSIFWVLYVSTAVNITAGLRRQVFSKASVVHHAV